MIGVIVFALLGALATAICLVLYIIGRFNLPDWATLPSAIGVWLIWSAVLLWLGDALLWSS